MSRIDQSSSATPSAGPQSASAAKSCRSLASTRLRVGCLLAAGLLFSSLLVAQEDEAASRLLLTARQQLLDGNLEAALTEYGELLERFPNSSSAPRALVDSASILFRSGDLDRADRLAERLISSHASSVEAAEAEVLRAKITLRSATSLAELAAARTRLERVPTLYGPQRFPRLEARAEARSLGARSSALLGDSGSALAGYLEVVEDEPLGAWTAVASLGMAKVLLSRQEWQAAAEILQEVADSPIANSEEGAGVGAAQPSTAREARTLLTLLHRMWLRPLASEPRWPSSRLLELPNIKKPRGVATTMDGQVAVTDPGASSLVVITRDGNVEMTGLPKSPGRPWFDAEGSGFVAIGDGVEIIAGRRKANFTIAGDKPRPLSKIQAGASGLFGETLVIDKDLDQVAVFDRRDKPTTTIGNERSEPVDVVTDGNGRVFVLSAKPPRVALFGADLQPISSFTPAATKPLALDIDLLGNLYVLDGARNTVEVVTQDGAAIQTLGPLLSGNLELRGPEDVAVDGIGRIHVADPKLGAIVVLE